MLCLNKMGSNISVCITDNTTVPNTFWNVLLKHEDFHITLVLLIQFCNYLIALEIPH